MLFFIEEGKNKYFSQNKAKKLKKYFFLWSINKILIKKSRIIKNNNKFSIN
jgi:hypothetical protein